MRSTSTLCCHITTRAAGELPDVVVTLPFLTLPLSVVIIFHVLGVHDHEDIRHMIVGTCKGLIEHATQNLIDNDAWSGMTEIELFEWIAKEGSREVTRERRYKYMEHIVSSEILPHMGLSRDAETCRRKAVYFGLMLRKLFLVYDGTIESDDRDHYCNKRLRHTAPLMHAQVSRVWGGWVEWGWEVGVGVEGGSVVCVSNVRARVAVSQDRYGRRVDGTPDEAALSQRAPHVQHDVAQAR